MRRMIAVTLFMTVASLIHALTIHNVQSETKAFYDIITISFQDRISAYTELASKDSLSLTFTSVIDGFIAPQSPYPVTCNGSSLVISLSGKVYWYRIERRAHSVSVFLYRYPRQYHEETSPEPSFTTYAEYDEYKKSITNPTTKTFIIEKTNESPKPVVTGKQWVIVIDPGHGGKAFGAVGPTKYKEKDLTLAVCLRVIAYLKDYPRVKVMMTRNDDQYVSLYDRAQLANKNKADFFVSVHANAPGPKQNRKKVRGIETFFLSDALTDEDRALAILENEDFKYEQQYQNQSMLDMLLSNLAQNQYMKESSDLAYIIQKNLIGSTRWVDRGVKQAPFYVLRFCYMPSVLLEIGFISHPEEEKLLKSDKYQDIIAREIADSIKDYIDKHDKVLSAQ